MFATNPSASPKVTELTLEPSSPLHSSSKDRIFLYNASLLAEPLCWSFESLRYRTVIPFEFTGSLENKTQDIACRILRALIAIPLLPMGIVLGAVSKCCRAIGFALQKDGYTYVQGTGPEKDLKKDPTIRLMTWNICGLSGGLSYAYGGVLPWQERFERIINTIHEANPDLLILEEIYDASLAEQLFQRLAPKFSHLYGHLGATTFGVGSGVMVFSRCPISSFTYTNFTTNNWQNRRGFATIAIQHPFKEEKIKIFGTHLAWKGTPEEAACTRKRELEELHSAIQGSSAILMGDLNCNGNDEHADGAYLKTILNDSNLLQKSTCTDSLKGQWKENPKDQKKTRTIDTISLFQKSMGRIKDWEIISAFTEELNPKDALSDHHAIKATYEIEQ